MNLSCTAVSWHQGDPEPFRVSDVSCNSERDIVSTCPLPDRSSGWSYSLSLAPHLAPLGTSVSVHGTSEIIALLRQIEYGIS